MYIGSAFNISNVLNLEHVLLIPLHHVPYVWNGSDEKYNCWCGLRKTAVPLLRSFPRANYIDACVHRRYGMLSTSTFFVAVEERSDEDKTKAPMRTGVVPVTPPPSERRVYVFRWLVCIFHFAQLQPSESTSLVTPGIII